MERKQHIINSTNKNEHETVTLVYFNCKKVEKIAKKKTDVDKK